jgi:hypothetical protein
MSMAWQAVTSGARAEQSLRPGAVSAWADVWLEQPGPKSMEGYPLALKKEKTKDRMTMSTFGLLRSAVRPPSVVAGVVP